MNENFRMETSEQNEVPSAVPYIVHEATIARLDNAYKAAMSSMESAHKDAQDKLHNQYKRQQVVTIIAILIAFLCNMIWLYCWMQYDYTTDTYTLESNDGGNANFIGNDGDITNGANSSKEVGKDPQNRQLS